MSFALPLRPRCATRTKQVNGRTAGTSDATTWQGWHARQPRRFGTYKSRKLKGEDTEMWGYPAAVAVRYAISSLADLVDAITPPCFPPVLDTYPRS